MWNDLCLPPEGFPLLRRLISCSAKDLLFTTDDLFRSRLETFVIKQQPFHSLHNLLFMPHVFLFTFRSPSDLSFTTRPFVLAR